MRSTADRYGTVARALHWSTGMAVMVLIATAVIADQLPRGTLRTTLYDIHMGLAVLIIPLILARLAWRWIDPPPAPTAWLTRMERQLATVVDAALLVLLLLQPVTGVAMYLFDGEAIDVFGWFALPPVPTPMPAVASVARTLHEWAAWPLYIAVVLHLGAVGLHVFVRRDGILSRMWGKSCRRCDAMSTQACPKP